MQATVGARPDMKFPTLLKISFKLQTEGTKANRMLQKCHQSTSNLFRILIIFIDFVFIAQNLYGNSLVCISSRKYSGLKCRSQLNFKFPVK